MQVSDRRKLRKHVSIQKGKEDEKKKLLEAHPLCLQWIVKTPAGENITVQFYYLTKFRIVTVKSSIDIGSVPEKTKE